MLRTIAIGDIHGCSQALVGLLAAIDPKPDDTIITLGDVVDRGLDSKGVLDSLLELSGRCRLIPLLGNHEEMLLDALQNEAGYDFWMECGGIATLDSYDPPELGAIPEEHVAFLKQLRLYYETERHFFTHASYDPDLPLDNQDRRILLWGGLDRVRPHRSGKIAIVGHTPQANHKILDLGYLKCIDAGCGEDGLLTALDVSTGEVWQVDEKGNVVVPNHGR
jgi:serine/threonine protein phosphatase 1